MTPSDRNRPLAAVILAAGLGTRMKSAMPKAMHPLAGRPMVNHVVANAEGAGADRIVVVAGPGDDAMSAAVAPHGTAVQHERLGTAHAVLAARDMLGEFDGDVLILFGADPLITPETLAAMAARRREDDAPAVVVLGFRPAEAGAYGRLITDDAGRLSAIVEAKDASPEQLAVDLCNSGAMCVDGRQLWPLLDRVGNDNAKGEYYLTDIVALARGQGDTCAVVEGDDREMIGVDSRADLAAAEAVMQQWLRRAAMDGGATLVAPETVFLSFDTVLGRDVTVHPHVVFGPGVTVEGGATINSFSHLEGARVAAGAAVGPYARLRAGAVIGEGARIGNFVEVKNAELGKGAKANHLAYVGDALVGAGANIGAGTITCNYDGFRKHRTEIGAGAFIGSNTALVAPVKVGDGAFVGAGSTIARDVAPDALGLTRADQREVAGWGRRKRAGAEKKRDASAKKDRA